MTRAEFIQHVLVRLDVFKVADAVTLANELEQSGAAPWDETAAKDIVACDQIKQAYDRGHRAGYLLGLGDGAREEREACSKIADAPFQTYEAPIVARDIRDAIRARGAK